MPSKCRVLVGPDLGDHPAQERADDRPADHAFHALIGHEPEKEAEQEWQRDVEVPPADLPLIVQAPRNIGFGFQRLLPRVGLRADRFKPSAALRP